MTTIAVVAAMLTGCGDKGPTPAEKSAAKSRWVIHVNAACRKATDAIAQRGYPIDLIDLDRLVVRGIGDVNAAITTIVREPLPVGADGHPAALVRELKALKPELERFSGVSEGFKPHALITTVDGLKLRLARIDEEAEKAGVRGCRTTSVRQIVPAAVRAPVFADQFNRLEHRVLRRLRAIGAQRATTPTAYGRALDRMSGVLARALDGIDRLDPPLWALDQTADYQRALRDLQSVVQEFSAQIAADRDKPPASVNQATYLRLLRKMRVAARAEGKAHRRMLRAVGAAPTTPPDAGGEPVKPESTEES